MVRGVGDAAHACGGASACGPVWSSRRADRCLTAPPVRPDLRSTLGTYFRTGMNRQFGGKGCPEVQVFGRWPAGAKPPPEELARLYGDIQPFVEDCASWQGCAVF